MGISISSDSSVCSVMRISGFGEVQKSGYNYDAGSSDYGIMVSDLKDFVSKLASRIEYYDDHISNQNNVFRKQGLVTAFVTDLQPVAKAVLTEFGGWTIVSSKDMQKYAHEVHMFVMPICDFIERFNGYARIHGLKELKA